MTIAADLKESVVMEDEAVEGNAGVADKVVQAKEVAVEATDATDKEVTADSVVEEEVAEETPSVLKSNVIFFFFVPNRRSTLEVGLNMNSFLLNFVRRASIIYHAYITCHSYNFVLIIKTNGIHDI